MTCSELQSWLLQMLRRRELINLWVFAVGVYPSDKVQQEESQPFQEGLWLWVFMQAFHPFIPLCPVGRSVALWAPCFWELQFPLSSGTSEVLSFTSCNAVGSGHDLFSDLPSRLCTRTCDLQYGPLTLLLVGVLSYMIHCSHGWALTLSWDLQRALCHTEGLNKQHPQQHWALVPWCQHLGFLLTKLLPHYKTPFLISNTWLGTFLALLFLKAGAGTPRSVEHRYPLVVKPQAFLGKKKMISLLTCLLCSIWTKICSSSLIDSGVF